MAEALLRGNGLAEVMRDDSGQVVELRPIPWSSVAVNLLPSGRIRFDYSDPVTNQQRQLFQEECLWLRDRSDNGMVGISRLSRAAGVVSNALSIQQFSTALYENGSWPGGFLETDNVLSQESKRLLVEQFEQAHQGPSKAARLMLLEAGLKFSPASPTPEDSELLSSRKFTVEEIGRIYNVPPPLIGNWEHASFTNSETAGRWFAQFTIAPWVRKLEMEISTSVLNDPDLTVEFDLSSFLRGDPKERWECNEIAVRNGILTVDEIREQEGYGPRPETNEAVTST
jgi:HK97 family phage portal protein